MLSVEHWKQEHFNRDECLERNLSGADVQSVMNKTHIDDITALPPPKIKKYVTRAVFT